MSKNIFITGASSGLGLSHAVYLTAKGYNVTGTSRNGNNIDLKKLEDIFIRDHVKYRYTDYNNNEITEVKSLIPGFIYENLTGLLKKIKFVHMDVTDDSSVSSTINRIESEYPIDILINNAGIASLEAFEDKPLEEIQKQFDVNFFGQIRVIKAFLPFMRKRSRGFIINTTSLASIAGLPFISDYSASKSGMERITESLYTELKPFGIKVSSLLPGDINTAIGSNMYGKAVKKEFITTDIKEMLKHTPSPENSPYRDRIKIFAGIFIKNHIISPAPLTISQKLLKIITAKNPKIHYISGSFMQSHVLPFMKSVLPRNTFLDMVSKIFGV